MTPKNSNLKKPDWSTTSSIEISIKTIIAHFCSIRFAKVLPTKGQVIGTCQSAERVLKPTEGHFVVKWCWLIMHSAVAIKCPHKQGSRCTWKAAVSLAKWEFRTQ